MLDKTIRARAATARRHASGFRRQSEELAQRAAEKERYADQLEAEWLAVKAVEQANHAGARARAKKTAAA